MCLLLKTESTIYNTAFERVVLAPLNFSVLHEIGKTLNHAVETDMIYLDLIRAFNTVCHTQLLQKLFDLGIVESLHEWFTSYLSSTSLG